MNKQFPIIMQDFSIHGILKQWKWQQKMSEWELKGSHVAKYQEGQIKSPVEMLQVGAETFTNIGCKTETRRLTNLKEINKNPDDWRFLGMIGGSYKDKCQFVFRFINNITGDKKDICSKYGVKGDEIWVRESFAPITTGNIPHDAMLQLDNFPIYVYKADEFNSDIKKWKSPLFMPRKASRITLINEGVTVERVQSISEESALREGFKSKTDFGSAWIEINGLESWEKNLWCWVLKFSVKSVK